MFRSSRIAPRTLPVAPAPDEWRERRTFPTVVERTALLTTG